MYGIDWDGPLSDDIRADNIVGVPSVFNPLTDEHFVWRIMLRNSTFSCKQ